jgi:hypothetical protein
MLGQVGSAIVDPDGDNSLGPESGIDGQEVAQAADEESAAVFLKDLRVFPLPA